MAREIVNRQVNIYIQSGEAQKAYDKLIEKQKLLNKQISETTDGKKLAKLKNDLAALQEPIDRAARKISGELEPSLKDTQAAAARLRNELSRMSESDPEYKKKVDQYRQANVELDQQRQKVGFLGKAWKSFWDEAKTVAAGVIIGNTIQAALQTVMGYVTGIVTGSAKIADELSDIEKTTGLTNEEVRALNAELGKIDTRTSRSELRKLAAEGGKLGYETSAELLKFVDAADKIRVALREDLGESAITDIAKASKIFGVEMLNMASAINEIGAASTASEAYSVDFIKRTGGVAATVKIAAGDVLGYSSALEQAGLTAEVSTTALNTFFLDFVSNIDKFGKAAGFAKGELAGILGKQGTNEAFLQFLERLKQQEPTAAGFINKLKDLGIDGARGSNVMLTLAGNIGEVRKQQDLANNAIQSNSSIMNEFNKKNNNAAAALDKFKKNVAGLFQSESFQAAGEKVIQIMNSFINVVKSSLQFIKEHGGLVATLGTLYALMVVRIRGASIAQAAHNVVLSVSAGINRVIAASQTLYTIATTRFVSVIAGATKAQKAWNVVTSLGAGPIGVLIVGIGALAIGVGKLFSKTKELTAAQKIQQEVAAKVAESTGDTLAKVEMLTKFAADENIELGKRKKAIEELIAINPEFANTLFIDAQGHLQGAEAIKKYIEKLTQKAEAEARYSLLVDKLKQKNELFTQLRKEFNTPGATDGKIEKMVRDQANKKTGMFSSIGATVQKERASSYAGLLDEIGILQKTAGDAMASIDKTTNTVVTANDKISESTDKTTKAVTKTKNALQELMEELARMQQEARLAKLSPMERELAELDIKFAALREKAGKNYKLLLIIDELYYQQRMNIIRSYAAKEVDAIVKSGADLAQKNNEQIRKNIEGMKEMQARLEQNLTGTVQYTYVDRMAKRELEVMKATGKKKLEAQIELLNEQERQELNNTNLTEYQRQQIQEKYRRARLDAEKNHQVQMMQQSLEIAQGIFNLISVFDNARTEKENLELEADRARNEAKKRNLDNRLKAGLISQLQYQRELDKLDQEQARKERKIRKEQFEREKRARIIQAIMNGAQAITTIWATTPKADFGIAQSILIGLSIASTLAQVATIAKQKAPEYARGGRLGGRTHAQGGNPITDGYGRKIGEIEAGEGIINRRSMGDRRRYTVSGTPSQIASRINSLNGWGVNWEGGAALSPRFAGRRPAHFNYPNIQKYFAAGGKYSVSASGSQASAGIDPEVLNALERVSELLYSLQVNGVTAYTILTDQEKQQSRLDTIRGEATMKG